MIALAIVVGIYFMFFWLMMRGDACWLCGATKDQKGCPLCEYTPDEPLV